MNAGCRFHQTGDLHGEKKEVQPCMGREGRWRAVRSWHGPRAAAPPARSRVEGGEHGAQSQEGARCSPEPSSLGTAAGARCVVWEGRSELCRVMQEGETVLVPVTLPPSPLHPGNALCPKRLQLDDFYLSVSSTTSFTLLHFLGIFSVMGKWPQMLALKHFGERRKK